MPKVPKRPDRLAAIQARRAVIASSVGIYLAVEVTVRNAHLPLGATLSLLFATSILIAVIFNLVFDKPSQRLFGARRASGNERTLA